VNAALYGIGRDSTPASGGALGLGHGRLESRGAANRYALADSYSESDFVAVLRQVQPAREPAIHPENMGGPDARPECSTSSDGMMPSAGRSWAGGPEDTASRQRSDRQLRHHRANGSLIAEHQGNGTMSAVLLRARTTRPKRSSWGTIRWRSSSSHAQDVRVRPPPDPHPAAASSLRRGRTSSSRLAAA